MDHPRPIGDALARGERAPLCPGDGCAIVGCGTAAAAIMFIEFVQGDMYRNPAPGDGHANPPDVVFETARGCVRRRATCGCLEVRFGNALLALQPDELGAVLAALVNAEALASGCGDQCDVIDVEWDRPYRPTMLSFNGSSCGWVFSALEAAEFHRLLAGARLLLDLPPTSFPPR